MMRLPFHLHIQAAWDLLRRYAMVFHHAWSQRRQEDDVPLDRHEREFLPANLELMETPAHPAAHLTMRAILLLIVVILLIAVFGRLDIVAVAKGKLIPSERVKTIQPAITGVVKGILVRDGERVVAGQPLIVLDATQAAADADKARSQRIDASLAAARAKALLEAQAEQRQPQVRQVEDTTAEKQSEAQRFATAVYQEYTDKLSVAQAELERREAELATTRRLIRKLEITVPIARREADDYKELARDRYVAQHDYLDKTKQAVEQEHELSMQRSRATELAAAIDQQRAVLSQTASQFRREQLRDLEQSSQQALQSRNDETKANTRQQLLTLHAPVGGVVQQSAVHTLGGVVTTAQSLMVIVPEDVLEVEAHIENKDVGFVNEGDDTIVKIDAFPYTRYGYLTGKVVSVSSDAVQHRDRRAALTFTARIRLQTNQMLIDGKSINLTPGMEVSAEIKTGKRAVAAYFFDPLLQVAQESMRER
ncbi:HlyD family type I secretion periplasmic adaptor subunit [Achromobacter xylosoxidans]|jgi:hemolysin D|uniref:HlyD family type I secretion periplasmic adaptor subunit n=1 Tax=Alcaligenes xylosoxydans xylosoxydans TaxID=85698 RepID=UPI0006BEBC13|nr:Hemolysin secretion protein D%2C plasmid [Achromobacter xylosoxidans]CUJ18427.1 Hemolysin secretion protein D%2C plasmid [Achromobacter xylosoxidans]CUJ94519.1 Hemolysin secretion protein D%2C plasmid [Achromobacter xylosoxidans]